MHDQPDQQPMGNTEIPLTHDDMFENVDVISAQPKNMVMYGLPRKAL
jgi:ATP-dependent 26S proteasome regulatory subunit